MFRDRRFFFFLLPPTSSSFLFPSCHHHHHHRPLSFPFFLSLNPELDQLNQNWTQEDEKLGRKRETKKKKIVQKIFTVHTDHWAIPTVLICVPLRNISLIDCPEEEKQKMITDDDDEEEDNNNDERE